MRGDSREPSLHKQGFGHDAQGLRHLRPLGCQTSYRPSKPRLNTFEERAADSLCLVHICGGLCRVLTADGKIVKTKHVKMFEEQFARTDLFEKSMIVNESPKVVNFEDDVEKNEDTGKQHAPVLNQEPVAYVPEVSSKFGVSDDDLEYTGAQEKDHPGKDPKDDMDTLMVTAPDDTSNARATDTP